MAAFFFARNYKMITRHSKKKIKNMDVSAIALQPSVFCFPRLVQLETIFDLQKKTPGKRGPHRGIKTAKVHG